jgi:hypothetical protein
MANLHTAIGYAKKGWRVFPCKKDKTPLTATGFKDATLDEEQIKKWWDADPHSSIGIATGPDSGIWVLDVDLPGGPVTVKQWEDQGLILPDTLTQKTGGGGSQYFFKWNGREIRNSSKKIGTGIDVRGNGGYVIVPPSAHPSGGVYQWTKRMEPQPAPDWLYDLIEKAKDKVQDSAPDKSSRYGESALTQEIMSLSRSTEGQRNENLNASAYSLGQLIGGGELDRGHVESMLLGVALGLGLKHKEARATINSGITSGMQTPRKNPHAEEEYIVGIEEQSNQSNQSKQDQQKYAEVNSSKQEVNKVDNLVNISKQESPDSSSNKPYNLAAHIKEWITNSTGSFTTDQIDREFCLKDRKDKINRSKILSIYIKEKLIRKDKTIKGKWHVIDSQIEWVDLDKADESPFPLILPFDLHEKISLPSKSIIVLAGSTNSGKTAFILNTLRLNINQPYEKIYCMSEMGDGEYKDRLLSFGDPLDLWKKNIKAATKSYDFDGVVQNHNPNGLTCIDYLEEVDGEYFKIPSSIRDVYDALGDGVAIIAIQKKTQKEFGSGGESTKDKSRLYMTIDFLCALEHCIICALKLTKVKKSIHENMQDKELHFRIERGCNLTVVMDWTPAGKVNRARCIKEYTQTSSPEEDSGLFKFKTEDGNEVTLSKKDHTAWSRKYTAFDLDKELQRISEYSYIHSWLKTKKSWFWQLGGFLDKKQKEEG